MNGRCHRTAAPNAQCTAPQLRRFIKSRPYVPMHELRRRFGIDGGDDDVTPVRLDPGWVYVGLPSREGGLLGELLKAGEIGYELSLDPRTPIVIGVYPMRPIPSGLTPGDPSALRRVRGRACQQRLRLERRRGSGRPTGVAPGDP